jgi:high-affinity Fe2+/Pb2+ permease
MSITKKTRITVLLSVIWAIIVFLVALNAGTQTTSWGKRLPFAWEEFLTVFTVGAVLPLLIVWGITWIRSAKEQTAKKETAPNAVQRRSRKEEVEIYEDKS